MWINRRWFRFQFFFLRKCKWRWFRLIDRIETVSITDDFLPCFIDFFDDLDRTCLDFDRSFELEFTNNSSSGRPMIAQHQQSTAPSMTDAVNILIGSQVNACTISLSNAFSNRFQSTIEQRLNS
jgi:hypothetical protein